MVRFRYFAGVALVLGLLLPGFAASHKKPDGKADGPLKLDREIAQLLSDPEAASGFWGIDAVALDSGKPIFRLNQDKLFTPASNRSEERRVGKECRSRRSPYHEKKR